MAPAGPQRFPSDEREKIISNTYVFEKKNE